MLRGKTLLPLSTIVFALIIIFITTSVLAQTDSPSVTVTPPTIPMGGTVTITITAASPGTIISSISVSGPPGNPGPWTWSGVSITMPDIGDSISITFPGGVFTIMNDPNNNIVGGPGTWSAGANTDTTGSYWVTVRGTEFQSPPKGFIVMQEFNVPEFAMGTAIVTTLGFSGFIVARRRLRKA